MDRIQRLWYMDWIRIIVILILVPFHSAVTCTTYGDAFIKFNQKVPVLNAFIWFMSIWIMPVLFMVSGMSSYFSMQHRTAGQYTRERYRKLIIPLFAGLLTVCTILSYFRALYLGTFHGTYLKFYPHFFTDGLAPKGNLNWGHLWFLAYLFLFSMILLPVFKYLNKENIKEKVRRASARFEKGLWIFFLALPIMLTETILRPRFPETLDLVTDWANVALYLILTLYGFMFALNQRMLDNIERFRIFSLVSGIALFASAYILKGDIHSSSTTFMIPAYNALMKFTWILTALGYAKKYLNHDNRPHSYLVNASFPVYIFHYLPITVIAYFIARSDMDIWLKYGILVVSAYPLTFAMYEILKKIPYVRFAFAIKQKGTA